jgi:hypothetical protein
MFIRLSPWTLSVALAVGLGVAACGGQNNGGADASQGLQPDPGNAAPLPPLADGRAELSSLPAEYRRCAGEWVDPVCQFVGTALVAYGADDRFFVRQITGPFDCRQGNRVFGDPLPGTEKACYVNVPAGGVAAAPLPPSQVVAAPGPAPTVDRSRLMRAATGQGSELYYSAGAPGLGDAGAFRTMCSPSHMNFDDAIVFPGQVGSTHLHVYFGNTGANGQSTSESISNTGNSTCRGGTANRSAYWVPAVIDTRTGTPIVPVDSPIYYKTGHSAIPFNQIQVIPAGLRMIAGDASARGPQTWADLSYRNWSCLNKSVGGEHSTIPNCAVGDTIMMNIGFPECWDGRNLDSPDHKSHMAYRDYEQNGGRCPASHPVALPQISFHVYYLVRPGDDPRAWRLSSDAYDTAHPGGYSLHADWFNGWKPEVAEAWTRNCLQRGLDCGGGNLGDGRHLGGVPE